MKYLILISLSFLLSCGYEHSYQASIDKQRKIDKQDWLEEICNLRDWSIECWRDAYSPDDMTDCMNGFKKRNHDIAIRYGIPLIDTSLTPQHASEEHYSLVDKSDRCYDNAQSLYDIKRCEIRLHEDMKKYRGC